MAVISQTIFSWCIFLNEKFCILIKILLKFVPNDCIFTTLKATFFSMHFDRTNNDNLLPPVQSADRLYIKCQGFEITCCYHVRAIHKFKWVSKCGYGEQSNTTITPRFSSTKWHDKFTCLWIFDCYQQAYFKRFNRILKHLSTKPWNDTSLIYV